MFVIYYDSRYIMKKQKQKDLSQYIIFIFFLLLIHKMFLLHYFVHVL